MRRFLICLPLIFIVVGGFLYNSYAGESNDKYISEDFDGNPEHDAAATKMLNRLRKTYKKGKVLFGQQDALMYGHSWKVEANETKYDDSDVKRITGDLPAVAGFDIGGLEIGRETNLDGVRFDQMRDAIIAHNDRGGVVTISWHTFNPINDGNVWKVTTGEQYVERVLNEKKYHDKFESWLKILGDFFLSLRDKDGNLIPVLFRPYHEYSVGFWWGDKYTSRNEYVELWRWTFNYLVNERQLTNLIWIYSPYNAQTEEEFFKFYPGDKYVDIFGFELYASTAKEEKDMKESNERFMEKANNGILMTARLAEYHNKLAAFCETGMEGMSYAKWWTKVLRPVLRKNKCAYVLCWRNAHQSDSHFYGPFPEAASEKDFKKFARSRQCLLLDDIN